MYNIKAAKKLADKYESITVKDIRNTRIMNIRNPMSEITGFGTMNCSLCKAAKLLDPIGNSYTFCNYCIYSIVKNRDSSYTYCLDEHSSPTYRAIQNACTSLEIKKTVRQRAKYIRSIIKAIENKSKSI